MLPPLPYSIGWKKATDYFPAAMEGIKPGVNNRKWKSSG